MIAWFFPFASNKSQDLFILLQWRISCFICYYAADLVSILFSLFLPAVCQSKSIDSFLHLKSQNHTIRTEWFINNSFGDCFSLSLFFIDGNHVPIYASFVDLIGPNRSVIIGPLYANTHIILFVKSMMWFISCLMCPSACNITPQLVTHSLTWVRFCRSNNDLTHFYWIKSRFDLNAYVEQIAFQLPSIATQFDNECHCNRSLNTSHKLTQFEWNLHNFVFMIIYFMFMRKRTTTTINNVCEMVHLLEWPRSKQKYVVLSI